MNPQIKVLVTTLAGQSLEDLQVTTAIVRSLDKAVADTVSAWFGEPYPDHGDTSEEDRRLVDLLRPVDLARHELKMATNHAFDEIALAYGFAIKRGAETYVSDDKTGELWIEVRQ